MNVSEAGGALCSIEAERVTGFASQTVEETRLSVSHVQQWATSMDQPKLRQSKALFLTVQRIMSSVWTFLSM
jgi:hypothetical protein